MSPGAERIYGYRRAYVRELNISTANFSDEKDLLTLQQRFPNLQRLFIDEGCLGGIRIGNISNWNLWGTLTKLNINLSQVTNPDVKTELLKILKSLPHLDHLESVCIRNCESISFTLDEFAELNSCVHELNTLILSATCLPLSPTDVARIPTLNQQSKVKMITFYGTLFDSRWICYFARKYPNLEKLAWISIDQVETLDLHQEETISILKSLPNVFQHLSHISIRTTGSTEQQHLIYWNILSQFNIPIKGLTHIFSPPIINIELLQSIVQSSTQSFSSTIETLTLQRDERGFEIQEMTTTIVGCPHLVDLNIHICGSAVSVNVILDRFPALKRLDVFNGIMINSGHLNNQSLDHGLRMVKASKGSLNVSAFSYLSFNCKYLEYIYLDGMIVFGPMDEESGKVELDMSWSNIHLLRLYDIRFKVSQSNFDSKNLINLMEIREKRLFCEDSKADEGGPASDNSTMWSNWYHIFGGLDDDLFETWNMRQLYEREFGESIEFFDNYEHNKKVGDTSVDSRDSNGLVKMDDWRSDFYRGNFSWIFQSLNRIVSEDINVIDTCIWNQVYDNLD
ncbi:hypothetical protein F4703DRAFT_1817087 [Phycomyces blakesleeanus]